MGSERGGTLEPGAPADGPPYESLPLSYGSSWRPAAERCSWAMQNRGT